MQVKDQIKLRMSQLKFTYEDVAGGLGVSEQTVRHWCSGRNFPGKRHTVALESLLDFKLDFSEGASDDLSPREKVIGEIATSLDNVDLETMQAISKLPKALRQQVSALVRSMAASQVTHGMPH
jgi:transcriptional regulator with XRE-family HTH domain